MQDTKLPLRKSFVATYLLATTKKSISCPDMASKIGVHVETAWTLIHRIQGSLQPDGSMVVNGEIEAEETYRGGKGMLDFWPGRLCKPVVFGAMEIQRAQGGSYSNESKAPTARTATERSWGKSHRAAVRELMATPTTHPCPSRTTTCRIHCTDSPESIPCLPT